MSKQRNPESQPVEFDCTHCGKTNTYPAASLPGKAKDGASSIVKKCTFCATDNIVALPEGWIFPRDSSILRGD